MNGFDQREAMGPSDDSRQQEAQDQRQAKPLEKEDHPQGKPEDDDDIGKERDRH